LRAEHTAGTEILSMPELLLELVSEEIPARMQVRAAEDLKRLVCDRLERAQLTYERAEAFVTPRRLALVVEGLPEKRPDTVDERKGPRFGSADSAIQGFLRAAGLISVEQAELRDTDKGTFYFSVRARAGEPTADLLTSFLPGIIWNFPWPRSMRWGDGKLRWVRPLQSILCILDGSAIKITLEPGSIDEVSSFDDLPSVDDVGAGIPHGFQAGCSSVGHRFLAPAWFEVRDFADYKENLRAAKVILDQNERRALILKQAEGLAATEGLRLREDDDLLDEVTGLVEWPTVMLGRIDRKFMDVPPEVLVTAMRTHQKYFSLLDAEGRLAPRFVLVANTEAADGGKAIIAGNERVLRARLADATFFWNEDRKRSLESRIPKLAQRVFYKNCSDLERVKRLELVASALAPACRAKPDLAFRAARLCKADLTTAMVGEFPELQGVMGRYYALHDGESPEVADAIAEHYAPQGPSDRCPTAPVSVTVALADKLDTLVYMFSAGEKPTGSKDPFALRRAALGAIRLIIENSLRIRLLDQFDLIADIRDQMQAARPVAASSGGVVARAIAHTSRAGAGSPKHRTTSWELLDFLADRLKVHLREAGVRHDLIAAVFAGGAEDDVNKLLARVDALRDFLNTDDGANLLTAYRRASNIVRIEENKDGTVYDGEADEKLLEEAREIELHQSLAVARDGIAQALACERYREAMTALADLRAPVDAFFDHVTVNCANSHLRVNRLRLLSQIRSALEGVADFSQIEG
jgi:glycyl-tRNA synthetase beta chain